MKIAVVTPGLLPVPAVDGGAVETLTTYIVENEQNCDVEYHVYTCFSERLKQCTQGELRIIPIKNTRLLAYFCTLVTKIMGVFNRDFQINAYLFQLMLRSWQEYDYILVENSMRAFQWLSKHPTAKNKLLYHMHNDIEGENGDKSVMRTRLVGHSAKLILTCSEYIGNRVKAIVPTAPVETLYNCIDPSLYAQLVQTERLMKRFLIEKDNRIVLYVGRLHPEKGVLELAQAMLPLLKKDKNLKLVIVGCVWFPDQMESPYVTQVKEHLKDVIDQVVFTGYQPGEILPSFYSMAEIVVIPSMCEEAFGMVALEAMMMKKPIVATKVGGLPEVLYESFSRMVEKNETVVKGLREGIEYLLKHPDEAENMGKLGYETFLSRPEFHKCNYSRRFYEMVMSRGVK